MWRKRLTEIDTGNLKELSAKVHGTISEMNGYRLPVKHDLFLEDSRTGFGACYPIKAVEKFLGYYDPEFNIAYNPSISFSTDFSISTAFCRYLSKPGKDSISFNGAMDPKYSARSEKALRNFRKLFPVPGHFQFAVRLKRRYAEAKGFSESSAVAGAVAKALVSCVFEANAAKDLEFVSTVARLVSGSGTRAVFNGFSIWESFAGMHPEESCAHPLRVDPSKLNFLAFPQRGSIATSSAHGIAVKSPFYYSWIKEKLATESKYLQHDPTLEVLLARGVEDSYRLHSILLSQGDNVWSEGTVSIIRKVKEFNARNGGLYSLMDTGPSVVVASMDRNVLGEFRQFAEMRSIQGSIPNAPPDSPTRRQLSFAEEEFDNLETRK